MALLSTRLRKVLRLMLAGLLALPVLGLAGMEGLDRYWSSEKGALRLYRSFPGPKTLHTSPAGLRYLELGDSSLPALVLLHGSPGGLSDWKGVAANPALQARYRLILPERPGYGATQPKGAEPSILEQALRCAEVLQGEKQPVHVAGYSYGAPVGLTMAALYPQRVHRFTGLAGQYDPGQEMTLRISYLLRAAPFRYLLPRWLWVSNEEKLAHPQALREVQGLWTSLDCDVVLVHGTADAIVPYGNSTWLEELLGDRQPPSKRFYSLEGLGHGIPFSQADTLAYFLLRP